MFRLEFACLLLLVASLFSLRAAGTVGIESDMLHFANQLERWLDADKRPCDDFYAYVCGRLQNSTQQQLLERRQHQQEKFDKFMVADDALDEQLTDAELKLKQFYVACRGARSVEDLKSSHLYRMSGGWPAIDESATMMRKRRNVTWLGSLSAFHDVGIEYFFRHRVDIKSNKRIMLLEPNEDTRYTLRKFEQLATDVMQEYAVGAGRARLVALETLSFERARRDIVKQPVEDSDIEVPYSELKSRVFGIELALDWDSYFRKLLGKPLKETDMVLVRKLPKLKQLFELLQRTTPTRLLNWFWIDYLMDKSVAECQALSVVYFEPVYQHIVARSTLDKVQMAQMYAALGRTYEQLLLATPWIDEMTHQNSKQFLGRVIHLTLNGDSKLDADYAELTVTKRNFYRNLEKCQRFLMQQRRAQRATVSGSVAASSALASQAANEFMKVFLNSNALPRECNLTTPLSYVLVGESFAEHMIAGGSIGSTPGAWRSTDSERDFVAFQQCIRKQQQHQQQSRTTVNASADVVVATAAADAPALSYNLNDLVLKMLAQLQTLRSYGDWTQQQDAAVLRRIDTLLAAGRFQLSLRKLYFIGSVLTDCQQWVGGVGRREFVHSYLRNSPEFTRAFECRSGELLHARNPCKVL